MSDDGGLDRFKARMRAVREAARTAVKPALVQGAHEIVDAMEALVAEGETGDLKNSIRVEDTGHDMIIGIAAGGEATTKPVRYGASARYDYALANEYGTDDMDPRPFFWPGYRSRRKRVQSRVKRSIAAAIKGVWGT